MPFTDHVLQQAWKRAGGRCECSRWTHKHNIVRCANELVLASRGKEGQGRWEAHRVSRSGGDTLFNCEILCWDCYKQALYEQA